MRPVQSLRLENFRGFVGAHDLDLDADLVLVSGKNGVGKSSILFALDMLLNGQTSMLRRLGSMLTQGKTNGRIAIVGDTTREADLSKLPNPVLYADLLERAHFFFPDSMDAPESASDVVSILEPQAGAWLEVRRALESVQPELAQRKATFLAQSSNVEGSRKTAAQQFEKALEAVDAGAFGWGKLGEGLSLLLAGGNLSNHWQSQLRNLLAKLESLSSVTTTPTDGIDGVLEGVALAIRTLRDEAARISGEDEDQRINALSAVANQLSLIDPERRFIWASSPSEEASNAKDVPIWLPDIEAADALWTRKILESESAAKSYANRERDLKDIRYSLAGAEDSLLGLLTSLREHAPSWMKDIQGRGQNSIEGKVLLRDWLTSTAESVPKLEEALQGVLDGFAAEAAECKTFEMQLAREASELRAASVAGPALRLFKGETWLHSLRTVGELVDYARKAMSEDGQRISARRNVMNQLSALEFAASNWANTERAIAAETAGARPNGASARPEIVFSEAELTVTGALARDGIFSLTSAINQQQFGQLLVTLNRLLSRFHFPRDFLPIRLEPHGRGGQQYRFLSRANVEYQGLSTGQKTQLAMCWTVCLSYALRQRLAARVVGFDDFTTALDMGQLIPAAGILRQLAYGNSSEYQRQVIVTSHHEDLTNRLVEHLLPPPGKSMKVVHIEEWTMQAGPAWSVFNAQMPLGESLPTENELGEWLKTQMAGRFS
jgi:energy-coupling factor transporter ATP-binding protein EcfA2